MAGLDVCDGALKRKRITRKEKRSAEKIMASCTRRKVWSEAFH